MDYIYSSNMLYIFRHNRYCIRTIRILKGAKMENKKTLIEELKLTEAGSEFVEKTKPLEEEKPKEKKERIISESSEKPKGKWIKYDYRTVCPKNHDVENPYWRLPEARADALKYCPYCGGEILKEGW